ncbi:FecR domain-containing protein [Larkinella harenae]
MPPSIPPHIDQLIIRFLAGEASPKERQQLETWTAADPSHRQYLDQMRTLWQHSESATDFAHIDAHNDWHQVKARINAGSQMADHQPRYPSRWGVHVWLKVAAASVLVLGVLIGLYRQQMVIQLPDPLVITATVQPLQLTLSDGTRVYLNKQASLTYPNQFAGQTRSVTLRGEAFFEVTKNPAKPFLITSGAVLTRVVGTSFSVNAPREDSVQVTVLTGKVALSKPGDLQESLVLTPGERGVFRKNAFAESANTDVNFLAWKTKVLTFQNTPIAEVVQDLNRYYGPKLELAGTALENCRLTTTFRQQSLDEVLAEIQLVLPVQIQRHQGRIILSGKGCL